MNAIQRLSLRRRITGHRLAALAVALCAGLFIWANVRAMDRWPAVSRDDIWVMSASYTLAERGVFGSDMFRGFHNADQHYFIALPAHHFLQAGVFRLFDPGLRQARAVALAAAVVTLVGSSLLAWRWYGAPAAVVTAALLGFWRLDLLGYGNGIPLSVIGVSGRYDATALAFAVLAVVALDLAVATRRTVWALACGVLCGLAALAQFFGVFALAVALLVTGVMACVQRRSLRLFAGLVAGFAAPVLPYVSWAHRYRDDFWGQAELKEGRTSFLQPGFYRANLTDELDRYQSLVPESVIELLAVVVSVAIALVVWRAVRRRRRSDMLLAAWLATSAGGLAMVESVNAPLYAVVVLPPAVIAVGSLAGSGIAWAGKLAHPADRSLVVAVVTMCVLAATWTGVSAYAEIDQRADHVSSYDEVSAQLGAAVPGGITIVGSERWWWPLREWDYLAMTNLWQQWLAAQRAGEPVTFAELMDGNGATYLLMDGDIWFDMNNYPMELADEIRLWLNRCAHRVWRLVDPTYAELQLFEFRADGCQ